MDDIIQAIGIKFRSECHTVRSKSINARLIVGGTDKSACLSRGVHLAGRHIRDSASIYRKSRATERILRAGERGPSLASRSSFFTVLPRGLLIVTCLLPASMCVRSDLWNTSLIPLIYIVFA